MRVKMSKLPPRAPTASAPGPCPTVIQIVGRPGTGSLPGAIAPPDHPCVLLIWILVGQGPIALAIGAGGGCLDIFTLIFLYSVLSPSPGWLVGCFGFNGPLRQYFSLYRAVSQREGERGEKG